MNSFRSSQLDSYRALGYFLFAMIAVALYLLTAFLQNGEFGFPLDDAWIHQVYARNIGTRFEFSFFAGQPSAGSTSPLWALLLSIGYALRMDFRAWAILLGIVFLGVLAVMTQRVMKFMTDDIRLANLIAPLFVLLEWHMLWAAASGMEILLFVLLSFVLVESFFAKRDVLYRGFFAGLLTLTRPEGILLVGLGGLGIILEHRRNIFSRALSFALFSYSFVFVLLLIPYFLFNLQTSGTLLPNTFYAKSAEYAELTQTNLFLRWLLLYRQPLIGAQLLLVPGLLYGVYVLARERAWERILPAFWIVLLPALYAWRLPVEYQFGRYVMPIIPFVIVYGLDGTSRLFQKIPLWLIRRAWVMTIAVLLIVFVFIGANLYAQSVAIVNCEMVALAKWTRTNLPPGALIAAHDIGAQGYFDFHPMLDLAGLVSPEVIPFIRDEAKLKGWMMERGARYAIFFPTWYRNLAGDARFQEIFSTDCALTRQMGEENLRVYEIR